jgi:hypothetical protein
LRCHVTEKQASGLIGGEEFHLSAFYIDSDRKLENE